MSFGYSTSDAVILVQLAWNTVQNSRKAVGEHDQLAREASSLHIVLRRLEKEWASPGSPINRPGDTCREELDLIVAGCSDVLRKLDSILIKHNSLTKKEKSGRKLWDCWRFGSKRVYLQELRSKLCFYTTTTVGFLNMISSSTIGRIEQQMDNAGGELREIRIAVNRLVSAYEDGSIMTEYSDDDPFVWREFRRELVQEGFNSVVIEQNKSIIQAYFRELAIRGTGDENNWRNQGLQAYSDEAYALGSSIESHRQRVHEQYTETFYDGDLGLGSVLGVELMDNRPPDAATDRPHMLDTKCPSKPESQLIPRETELPLEVQRMNEHRHGPPRSQALVDYDAPLPQSNHRNKAQSSTSPRSKCVKPRTRPRGTEPARRLSTDQSEKKRRREKNMTRLFFGGVVVAHVLISFV
ncbi:MAG: hypothetical protein Q9195_002371 [Heterodermia aff. obscurata]